MKEPQILLGKLSDGLYQVQNSLQILSVPKSLNVVASASEHSQTNKGRLWHLRLGHLPFSQLKHIIVDCPIKDCIDTSICKISPMSKQTRLPFPSSSIKSNDVFQLIHIDLWGPYRVSTHNSCNQFITIVDDFSRYTWTHLIQYKSDVTSVLNQIFMLIETQFQKKIQRVRSDNAKELCEGPLKQFFLQKGILHETSCVDTPQKNGVVERKHRHIVETARALFFQAKLPIQF